MESHLVRIINRLEAMAKDGGNLKRNFTLRDVEARETYTFDSIDLIAMEIYELLY